MLVTKIEIQGHSFDILSDDQGYGWCRTGEVERWTGLSVTGKPFDVSRCKFATIERCTADLADHLSYYHGVRRTVSSPVLESLIDAK